MDIKQELLDKMREKQIALDPGLSLVGYHLQCINIMFEVAAEYLSNIKSGE